jgi:hypothetical protein
MDDIDAAYHEWVSDGRPFTDLGVPPGVKLWLIRDYARRFGLRVLVETGSYKGDSIDALLPFFDDLYSVELGPHLYEFCLRRFADAPNVHLHLGESPAFLRETLRRLDRPALFYLDAHWSMEDTVRGETDTPIVAELEVLHELDPPSVIIIDDARLFGTDPEYPTVDWVTDYVRRSFRGHRAEVVADEIVIRPVGANQ